MQLQPKRPPGRADRKAAAYASEIGRLRGDGYTYAAIREALADVGIELSASTVQREVRRLSAWTGVVSRAQQEASPRTQNAVPPIPSAPAPEPAAPVSSSSRDVAEAFFNAHPNNPLFRAKEIP